MFFHGKPRLYSKTQASDERLIKFKTYNGRKNYSVTECGIEGSEWQILEIRRFGVRVTSTITTNSSTATKAASKSSGSETKRVGRFSRPDILAQEIVDDLEAAVEQWKNKLR